MVYIVVNLEQTLIYWFEVFAKDFELFLLEARVRWGTALSVLQNTKTSLLRNVIEICSKV